jgi:hypothetical protein
MNIHPWQEKIFDQITAGGFKPSELVMMSAGRGEGKSIMNQQYIDRLMREINSRPIEELVLSEGSVYGARYHCVEPIGGNWREMEDWCISTYGKTTGSIWADKTTPEPGERWYANNRKFWFRNESDRTMFILKWR